MFRVRKEHTRKVKTLHRNQLLPFMSLPVKTRYGPTSSCVNSTDNVWMFQLMMLLLFLLVQMSSLVRIPRRIPNQSAITQSRLHLLVIQSQTHICPTQTGILFQQGVKCWIRRQCRLFQDRQGLNVARNECIPLLGVSSD